MIDTLQGVIFIVTYFVCLWASRIIFLIIVMKLIEEIQRKFKENIESTISGLKGKGKNDEM